MSRRDRNAPPAPARWLLETLLDPSLHEALAGDLEEEWRTVRERRGRRRADRWYWRQAIASVLTCRRLHARVLESPRSHEMSLLPELRTSVRRLVRTPGYSLVVVLVLGLGVGLDAAVFSVVRSVLLDPLPYPEPERIGLLRISMEGVEKAASISAPEIRDFREQATLLEQVGAQWTGWNVLRGEGDAERIRVSWTTGLFELLGAEPRLGRRFTSEEEEPANQSDAIILSDHLWRTRFGSDPDIVGRTITLESGTRTVVGVMPPGFRVMLDVRSSNDRGADAWIPNTYWTDRDLHWLRTAVRLAPGATWEQAQDQLDEITRRLVATHPEYAKTPGLRFDLDPLAEELARQARPAVLALFAAALLVLAISSLNVGALALARLGERDRELWVRLSLGAGRARVAGAALLEHLLLGLVAAAFGLGLALGLIHSLRAAAPSLLPRVDAIALDAPAFALALAIALLSMLLLTAVPLVRRLRSGAARTLLGGSGLAGAARGRWSASTLIAAEVAVALALLVATGLLVRSARGILDVDLGFEPSGVTTAELVIPFDRYPETVDRYRLLDRYEGALQEVAEIDRVGAANLVPLASGLLTGSVAAGERSLESDVRTITAGYLDAIGVRLVEGRFLDGADLATGRRVAVVDEPLARALWPDRSPIGETVRVTLGTNEVEHEIVGVSRHLRYHTSRDPGRPQIHVPYRGEVRMTVAISSTLPAAQAGELARQVLRRIDPEIPRPTIASLDGLLENDVADLAFALRLMGAFSALALLLALIGTYGVLAYWVSRRVPELGLHMALGADRGAVVRHVLRRGGLPAVVGIGAGLLLAAAGSRLLGALLFDVAPLDPPTYIAAAALLAVAALCACWLPARKAARIDPTTALRSE